jgi:SAM-dependent methyltransferase
MIEPQFIKSIGKVADTAPPKKLVGEAVGFFGKEPQRIMDVGCSVGTDALYLAMQGHKVTALDTDRVGLDWARERARDLGVATENFTPKVGDLRDITSSDKYQGVLSIMVLHFFEEQEAKKATRTLQAMTTPNGLNVVSVYTDDNPEEEITHPSRGLKYMFKSGELSGLYSLGWVAHRDCEGYTGKYMRRDFGQGRDVLIPTVAELIVRKTVKVPRTYMNASRQVVSIS